MNDRQSAKYSEERGYDPSARSVSSSLASAGALHPTPRPSVTGAVAEAEALVEQFEGLARQLEAVLISLEGERTEGKGVSSGMPPIEVSGGLGLLYGRLMQLSNVAGRMRATMSAIESRL